MKKIFTLQKAIKVFGNAQSQGRKLVMVGGCFDILHTGHVQFLTFAKNHGDHLMVLLESDEAITASKGPKRPINRQKDRANVLAGMSAVDSIVLLPKKLNDKDYDELILSIKPAIIATTREDSGKKHKKRQAEMVGAKVIDTLDKVTNKSTSRIASLLDEEL